MGAITDLWKSERGLLAVLIIIAASVLAGLDKMPVADWQTFVTGIFIAYAAGKTVTSAVQIMKAPSGPEFESAVSKLVDAAMRPPTDTDLAAAAKKIVEAAKAATEAKA